MSSWVLSIGLVPNTLYRVTVSAKTLRAPTFDQKRTSSSMEKFSTHINFKTLPKGKFFFCISFNIRIPDLIPLLHNSYIVNFSLITHFVSFAKLKANRINAKIKLLIYSIEKYLKKAILP